MEFIIILVILTISTLILRIVFKYNVKEIKHIGENKELYEIARK